MLKVIHASILQSKKGDNELSVLFAMNITMATTQWEMETRLVPVCVLESLCQTSLTSSTDRSDNLKKMTNRYDVFIVLTDYL